MIDWPKLVAQGRAKAYGVSWTEEEARAVSILKIPAEFVRQGILTLEAYEKAKISAAPSKNKDTLLKEAKDLGIAVTPEATVDSLTAVISAAKEAKENNIKAAKPKETKETKKVEESKAKLKKKIRRK